MCGIVGVITPTKQSSQLSLYQELMRGILSLQHRGQDGHGQISSYPAENSHTLLVQKKNGVIKTHPSEATRPMAFLEDFQESTQLSKKSWPRSLTAPSPSMAMGIAHNRYATFGGKKTEALGPFWVEETPTLALAHNGNLINYLGMLSAEKQSLPERSFASDSELMTVLLHLYIQKFLGLPKSRTPQVWPVGPADLLHALEQAVRALMQLMKGSYSCTGWLESEVLFAFRDPAGIRPLVMGKKGVDLEASYCFASESTTLTQLGYSFDSEVRPGELVMIESGGQIHRQQICEAQFRPCFFEWVYFAHPESELSTRGVTRSREKLGEQLALKISEEKLFAEWQFMPDYVSGVPETGRVAARVMAQKLGMPYQEILQKNPEVQRSFILSHDGERRDLLNSKFIADEKSIRGKSFLLVDDSIVRGNTVRRLIDLLSGLGAKEIVLVSTCPPIRYPCFLGIDFPHEEDLIAYHYSPKKMAQVLGVKAVLFLDEKRLLAALNFSAKATPCMGCLNANYACTLSEKERSEFARERKKQQHE